MVNTMFISRMAEWLGTLPLEPKLRPIRFQLSFNLDLTAGRGRRTGARPADRTGGQTETRGVQGRCQVLPGQPRTGLIINRSKKKQLDVTRIPW